MWGNALPCREWVPWQKRQEAVSKRSAYYAGTKGSNPSTGEPVANPTFSPCRRTDRARPRSSTWISHLGSYSGTHQTESVLRRRGFQAGRSTWGISIARDIKRHRSTLLRVTHRHASVVEPEQRLRIVVEDLVGIGFRQAQPLDVSEGLLIGLVILQYRVVTAGHQMVGAKGFEGADECRL